MKCLQVLLHSWKKSKKRFVSPEEAKCNLIVIASSKQWLHSIVGNVGISGFEKQCTRLAFPFHYSRPEKAVTSLLFSTFFFIPNTCAFITHNAT